MNKSLDKRQDLKTFLKTSLKATSVCIRKNEKLANKRYIQYSTDLGKGTMPMESNDLTQSATLDNLFVYEADDRNNPGQKITIVSAIQEDLSKHNEVIEEMQLA